MKISFNTALQIISEILKDKLDMMSLELAIQDVASKYEIPEEVVVHVCNIGNVSY